MHRVFSRAAGYLAELRRRRLWKKLVVFLACIVVFCTTYALILPAITIEISEFQPDGHVHSDECYQVVMNDIKTILDCPIKVHVHTPDCYDQDGNLSCGYADYVVHTHMEYCYDADGVLVCTWPEIREHIHTEECLPYPDGENGGTIHTHTEDCYTIHRGSLICGQEEAPVFADEFSAGEDPGTAGSFAEAEGRIDDESCYASEEVSGIGLEIDDFDDGSEGHIHTEECYEHSKVLTCGFNESFTEEMGNVFSDGEQEPLCGMEEVSLHTHNAVCFDSEGNLVCGRLEVREHQHTEDCLRVIQEASKDKILNCPYASSGGEEESGGEADVSGGEAPEGKTFLYEDGVIALEVILKEEDTVPEDAVLTVQPVTEAVEGYDYERLKKQADAAVGGKALQTNFYDISFYTPEGEYIPVTETATLHFRDNGFLAGGEEVAVLHYQTNEDAPMVLENIRQETDENGITALTFQTEGFSVFAVMTLTEGEPVSQTEEGSFTLTYNNYTITFLLVDSDGNPLPGDYTEKNITAEDATRYVFGGKDAAAEETDTVVDRIAPVIDGYTYSGATGVTGTDANDNSKVWSGAVYSVATDRYQGTLGGTVTGFKFYTSEPLTDRQFLSWGYGNYTVTLAYTQNEDNLDNRTFAIVNRTNGDRALTASATTVNNVPGLSSQSVTVVESDMGYQTKDNVTEWTFHRQADGTYTISTMIAGENGQRETKYLCLNKTPFDSNSNDGRGSLTLTEEAEASRITVTVIEDGRVTMTSGSSCINMDASGNDHSFWCFNNTENDNSRHYLCEILDPTDYSGEWVIVNKRKNDSTGIAMQSGGIGNNDTTNRAGLSVKVRKEADDDIYTVLHNDAAKWRFEKQRNGTYYISTKVMAAEGTEEVKYLTIGNSRNAAVTLSENPQEIRVTRGTGDYADMVRLTNSNGFAVNLFNRNADSGFCSYNDSGANEWHTLCRPGKIYEIVGTTANHPSSVIHLFDYWVTTKTDTDHKAADLNAGINAGHALKFTYNQGIVFGEDQKYNSWTGSETVYSGIVQKKLGEDGYPVLNVGNKESLDYLFNPETANSYRESYRNASGLLQIDSQGYYYYNSAENFAEYNEDTNSFTLYDTWGVLPGGTSPKGQFFPFNDMDEVVNVMSTDDKINHYLGLTLTTRFVQQYGGHTTSSRSTETVFNFAGDDDVWIFIDNVLVADLGGIHNAASVSINFASGQVLVNGASVGTLKSLFADAGSTLNEWSGDTFVDNTYHTLKFFYMERGNTDSNLSLQYNLTEIPPTAIYKVSQYGKPVAGAEFTVYPANSKYEYSENNWKYKGTTDANGEMVFKDQDGMPYSLDELRDLFGEYFVLKETKAPKNYSLVSDEIHLYINNGLLLCENTYESGVWSSPTLQVAAPNTLKLVTGDTIPYYDLSNNLSSNGTLFAVVLKYKGNDEAGLTKQGNWSPVYGSDKEGYTILDNAGTGETFVKAAIEAAKAQQNPLYGNVSVCFTISASGSMQLNMPNLPGDISNYYYMLDAEHKAETQYTVAYYWTSAGSLDEADSTNTWRVDADDSTHKFDRVFGADIEVPNIINRLFAQKLNEQGELVNGAKFALYAVEEIEDKIYYKSTNGASIYLEPDTDGDNSGTAVKKGDTGKYTYRINPENGNITIGTPGENGEFTGTVDTITAYKTAVTLAAGNDDLNPSREDGTATFSGLDNGKYYMREIAVPVGYQLNTTEVMVLVADDAVYANAGTADDGVTVARGPGYLVATLSKFASPGDIDNTLSWVYEQMRISGENHTFTAYDNEAWKSWGYLKENDTGNSGSKDEALITYLEYVPYVADNIHRTQSDSLFNYTVNTGRYSQDVVSSIRRRLYTTVGWSYYELYQDFEYGSEHSGSANYTPLLNKDGTLQEIAHLFSRSTYIQVTDKKADGTLEISKTVRNAPEGNSESYPFTVNLQDENGKSLVDSYIYRIYDIVTSAEIVNGEEIIKTSREPVKGADGQAMSGWIQDGGTITLTDRQVAVIEHLPAGTRYTVTEKVPENNSNYIVSVIRDKGKVRVGEGTGELALGNNIITGTLYWAVIQDNHTGKADTDTISTVDYTNTYPSDLTIHKVDSSNHMVSLSGAEFVLYKNGEDNSMKLYYSYTAGNQDSNEETSGTTSWKALNENEKEELYKLTTDGKGQIILYGISDGTYFLKELAAPEGYNLLTEEIEVKVQDGKLIGNYGTTGAEISEGGLILTVPNSTGYELPSTGGHGTLLYILCGIGLMSDSLMYLSFRRRRRGGM